MIDGILKENRFFSIPEMADILDVCPETIRKYIQRYNFTGKPGKDSQNKNITIYSYYDFSIIKGIIEEQSVVYQNYYTTSQIADLTGLSKSCILAIVYREDIPHLIKTSKTGRQAWFPKESFEKIQTVIKNKEEVKKIKRENKERVLASNDVIQDAEEHPLVKDNRFLRLSYWPDVVPKCFENLDSITINF